MKRRVLTRLPVPAGPDGVLALIDALPGALSGEGPAIAPIPAGPSPYVRRILAAVRPDDPRAPVENDDVAIVVTTSGSMGEVRGVLLSGPELLASARASAARLGPPGRWLLALPVHHIAGLQVLVRSYLSGLHPFALDSLGGAGPFTGAEFVNATRAVRSLCDIDGVPLRTALVPTQLSRILALGSPGSAALSSYDCVLLGGAAAPAALLERARATGTEVVTTYGMTETCGGCVYDGVALTGVEVAFGAGGQIQLTGPMVASGYRRRRDLTAAAFTNRTFRTADIGEFDAYGRLRVIGRCDDVVQVGGVNVSVAAAEAAVAATAYVAEAAVTAVADDELGTRLVAFVTPAGAVVSEHDLAHDIIRSVADVLGPEARPRQIVLMDELPLLPTGKIDRVALRARAASSLEGNRSK